ncbi:MAG: DUF4328 domain-containing protein [Mycetocola sp.]
MSIQTSPPAGWYPAPDGSSASWWWDGARWTTPSSQFGGDPATTTRVAKLAVATEALLIIYGAISVVAIGVQAFGISSITVYMNGYDSVFGLLETFDWMTVAASIVSGIAFLATAVLWLLWQYRVAKQFSVETQSSAGWHVGSWFVPIISWWVPYQNISDLWRAVGRSRPVWQIVWWLSWLAGNVALQIANSLYTRAQDLEQLRIAASVTITGQGLMMIAASLAWLIIRGITQGAIRRSSG